MIFPFGVTTPNLGSGHGSKHIIDKDKDTTWQICFTPDALGQASMFYQGHGLECFTDPGATWQDAMVQDGILYSD
jgi:hypothetical protein